MPNWLSNLLNYICKLLKNFYIKNKVFSWMLIVLMLGVFIVHIWMLFFIEELDYTKIGKIWEIGSSLLAVSYTIWFWWFHKKGKQILDTIKDEKPQQKTQIIVRIAMAILMLMIIVFVNIFACYKSNLYWHLLTLTLMIITFVLFCWIDLLIIANHQHKLTRRDFYYALNNSDIPGVITFTLLAIYFICLHEYKMELFFSGAIAFQMLYSSFVWANTEITNQ